MTEHLLGVYEQEYLDKLKSQGTPETFLQIIAVLVDHSIKAQADLSYDMNAACNSIMQRFPGKTSLTVSEVHQTLRDLGIVDYDPADFSFIETTLKRFGILVQPDSA